MTSLGFAPLSHSLRLREGRGSSNEAQAAFYPLREAGEGRRLSGGERQKRTGDGG